jgi:hypothetical protein
VCIVAVVHHLVASFKDADTDIGPPPLASLPSAAFTGTTGPTAVANAITDEIYSVGPRGSPSPLASLPSAAFTGTTGPQ